MNRLETLMEAALTKAAKAWAPKGLPGVSFTIDGGSSTFYGVHDTDVASLPLDAGGFLSAAEGTIHAVKSQFATMPVAKQQITITMDGTATTRRILQVITSQGDPGVQLVYGELNR